MAKSQIWCLVCVLLLLLVGCSAKESGSSSVSATTYIGESNQISSSVCLYPTVTGTSNDFTDVNLLIQQAVDAQLKDYLSDDYSATDLTLTHSITFQSEKLLCILFEGTYSGTGAAHPSSFAFSVCILLENAKLVDPLDLFVLNEEFVPAFRKQLHSARPDRFDEQAWNSIVAHIEAYSDEELVSIICSAPQETLAPHADGVIVLFPVAHAAGDYVKVDVPFLWASTT